MTDQTPGPVPGPALDLDAALHEASEDRRIAGLMRQHRNRAVMERRAETIEALVAEVKRLRQEREPHGDHLFEPGVDVDMRPEGRAPDPRWCNVCGEARTAVPEPKQGKQGFVHTLRSGLTGTGLPDELPSDLAAEVDRQLDAIDEARARAAASAANYIIRGAVPESGEQPKETR